MIEENETNIAKQQRILALTKTIEDSLRTQKGDGDVLIVRVLFSRQSHFFDKKDRTPRLMGIMGVQEEKESFITKIVFFHSTFTPFDWARTIQPGEVLELKGFVRQSGRRILLQQASFVKQLQSDQTPAFPAIHQSSLRDFREYETLLLSEPLHLDAVRVGEKQTLRMRCGACYLEWPAGPSDCSLCGGKFRVAQYSVSSVFTNHSSSRGRVWLNATHSRSLFDLEWEELLLKVSHDSSLRFLEKEAEKISMLKFHLIFSHGTGETDRDGNPILNVEAVFPENMIPLFLDISNVVISHRSPSPAPALRRRRKM